MSDSFGSTGISTYSTPHSELHDTIDRLYSLTPFSKNDWIDLLGLTWKDYYHFCVDGARLCDRSLENLARHFKLNEEDLLAGRVDFLEVEKRQYKKIPTLPDFYLQAAHGRRRTTMTSVEYIEKKFGWRLKTDMLDHFGVSEVALQDAFASTSIQLITDMCTYLQQRHLRLEDFFQMGRYSYEGNRNTIVGTLFSEMETVEEVYKMFCKTIAFFENNSFYNYEQTSPSTGSLILKSIPDVASELGATHVGSEPVCYVKGGVYSSLPAYLGLKDALVTHVRCEHRGDDACEYHIDQSTCTKLENNN